MQVSAAVRRRKTSLLQWSLVFSQFLVRQRKRTNRAQHLDPWIRTTEGRAQVRSMTKRIRVANGVCNQRQCELWGQA